MSTHRTTDSVKNPKPAHRVVSREEWTKARKELLEKEKAATRLQDELSAERLALPWVKVEKNYAFEGAGGEVRLTDLFEGRSQLAVYHFMFGPDWQEGCPSCSFVSDHFNGMLPHLAARDVTLVVVSRAPLEKIVAFRERMGWEFPWVSSHGGDFNLDYHVSFPKDVVGEGPVEYNYRMEAPSGEEGPGMSFFYKDGNGEIFHTYSTYGRGVEQLMSTYKLLDMAPKGRDESELPFGMAWVRHHDRYETDGAAFADADKPYWPDEEAAKEAKASKGCGCGPEEAQG